MNWHKKTIAAYDNSAKKWADNFKKHHYGPRYPDIELALKLAKCEDKQARVVEIGCGDGRDAEGIIERVAWYQGFDPSRGLLNLARDRLPNANFVLADTLSYEYPENIDVVFAFVSLLHIDKHKLPKVMQDVANCLRPGGVLFFLLKESETYAKDIRTDENGDTRMFYLYNPGIITSMSKDLLKPIYENHVILNKTKWFTMALKKP